MDSRGTRSPLTLWAGLALGAALAVPASARDCAPPGTAPAVPGWQPIETAPQDRQVLLGTFSDDRFLKGVGHWDVRDELGGGLWSVEDWWGVSPKFWAALPPEPCDQRPKS